MLKKQSVLGAVVAVALLIIALSVISIVSFAEQTGKRADHVGIGG